MDLKKRIVISGGPGGGKTTLINLLQKKEGLHCFEEVSRNYIDLGKQNGMENYFKAAPKTFSTFLWEERIKQHEQAKPGCLNFYDRSLVDVVAYLRHVGSPALEWEEALAHYPYDLVFLVEPVAEIYRKDEQRLETFEEAISLHKSLERSYQSLGKCISVPFLPPEERVTFILNHCFE